MDEREFRRLLDLFPVVRSRNYCVESGSASGSSSQPTQNNIADPNNAQKEVDAKDDRQIDDEDIFWQKLRIAAERKVGPMKAEQFCKAFQKAHEILVHKELSLEAAQRFINAEGN